LSESVRVVIPFRRHDDESDRVPLVDDEKTSLLQVEEDAARVPVTLEDAG